MTIQEKYEFAVSMAKPVTAKEKEDLLKVENGQAWVQTLESLRVYLSLIRLEKHGLL